jgi:hypothetical protein
MYARILNVNEVLFAFHVLCDERYDGGDLHKEIFEAVMRRLRGSWSEDRLASS